MRAMVLAAGLGSRLRPLTAERPKPGVPYGQRPLACVALDALAAAGISHVVMNTHHLGETLPGLLAPHLPADMQVTYVHEPVLLGTGGGLRNALPHLHDGEPIVVMNSDIVFRPDVAGAVSLHRRLGALATMVVRPDVAAKTLGAIEVDDAGRVRRLLGEPENVPMPLSTYMFTGVHVLEPRAFEDLPESGCVVRHGYRQWIERDIVAGFVDESPWQDLGTLERYLSAHVDPLAGSNDIAESAVVHPDARISDCVIGAGAVVGAHRLRRVVVWPNGKVERDLEDAIVTTQTVTELG